MMVPEISPGTIAFLTGGIHYDSQKEVDRVTIKTLAKCMMLLRGKCGFVTAKCRGREGCSTAPAVKEQSKF